MSIFCTEYLISSPFNPSLEQHQVKELFVKGYYAFQDHAILHMVDRLSFQAGTLDQELTDRHEYLNTLEKKFRDAYSIHATDGTEPPDEGPTENIKIGFPDPPNTKASMQWIKFEQKMSQIRRIIELTRDDEYGSDKITMEEIYGLPRFKCPRFECKYFSTGFISRKLRDQHLDRHNRPFSCLEPGCLYQSLGFATEAQLKRHLVLTHAQSSDGKNEFPQPTNRKNDNIFLASTRGDLPAVRRFLSEGVDINSQHHYGRGDTALFIAARNSHLHVCEALVEQGANISYPEGVKNSKFRSTSLHEAAANNDIEMIQYFLSTRADVLLEERDGIGRTPVERALESGATAVVNILQRGIQIQNLKQAVFDRNWESVRLLCKAGNLDLDTTAGGRTLLSWAAEFGELTMVESLLSTQLVNPESSDDTGKTPLHHAALNRSTAIVEKLLAIGKINPDINDDDKRTPLSYAVEKGYLDVATLLIETGQVNLNAQDKLGRSPLHYAALSGRLDMVRMLLAAGNVDPDINDYEERTPLSYAAEMGFDHVALLLMEIQQVNINAAQ